MPALDKRGWPLKGPLNLGFLWNATQRIIAGNGLAQVFVSASFFDSGAVFLLVLPNNRVTKTEGIVVSIT